MTLPTRARRSAALALGLACMVFPAPPVIAEPLPAVPAPAATPAAPAQSGTAGTAKGTVCEPLSAIVNRPTTTRITCVVPRDHALIESGFLSVRSQGTTTRTYPSSTLRVGTKIKNLEIQAFTPSYVRQSGAGGPAGAVTDAGVGAAYQLYAGPRFAHVVQASLTLPTGDPQATSGGYAPTLSYQGVYAVSKIFSLSAGLAQTARVQTNPGGGVDRNGVFTPSFIVSASLPAATTLFAEAAHASHDRGKGTGTTQYLVGVLKDFGARLQADVEYVNQRARNNGAPDTTGGGFGAGLAYYF